MPKSRLAPGLEKVCTKFYSALATPTAELCLELMRRGEWDQLVSLKVDPSAYAYPADFYRDAAAVSLLRKCQDVPTSFDRKAVAMSNFVLAEQMCRKTNERLAIHLYDTPYDIDSSEWGAPEGACAGLIAQARKEMALLLGPAPKVLKGRFGPGATYGDRGQFTTVPDKMSSRPTLTPSAMWFLPFEWGGTAWARNCAKDGRQVEVVRGNRFTTVPKDCTKDRGIAVEPSINLFFQLDAGRHLRSALRRSGINLIDGQAIHKQVACEASTHGRYATLDLSNASDTVCKNLVKLLLPDQWFDLLNTLRSPKTLFEGRWVQLEKFSSMGNGFTFELETAIFLSLILAVRNLRYASNPGMGSLYRPGSGIWVYGDDIIIPTAWAGDVIAALRYCGFETNNSKSFVKGPFRESCGGDYFRGMDVRPHFIEEEPREPQQWISLANGISRVADRLSRLTPRCSSVIDSWFATLDSLPSDVRRLRGPVKLGDLVIHDTPDKWQIRSRHGRRYIGVYRPARFRLKRWDLWDPDTVLASVLYLNSSHVTEGVIPRDGVAGYKVGWVHYPEATSTWLPSSPDVGSIGRSRPPTPYERWWEQIPLVKVGTAVPVMPVTRITQSHSA